MASTDGSACSNCKFFARWTFQRPSLEPERNGLNLCHHPYIGSLPAVNERQEVANFGTQLPGHLKQGSADITFHEAITSI